MTRKTNINISKQKTVRAKRVPVARDPRETILEIAERLCGERGLEAVSVRDIAAEAGCNLAAINYYFRSRQNLLLTILKVRVAEIELERQALLAPLLVHPEPRLRDIIRAILTPLARWRVPSSPRRPSLQFLCRALTAADPDMRAEIGKGVRGFQQLVPALQRAVPYLGFEELCWRFHFMMSIEHMNPWDVDRLEILAGGKCRASDLEESLERAVDFAEAGFLAPQRKFAPTVESIR
jgi:AcrR family transcriptional regulator